MPTTNTRIAGTETLGGIEALARQEEEVLGPLVGLGSEGADTVLTFDMDDPPPTQPVVLRVVPGGAPPTADGLALVVQGTCLVTGLLTTVAALRAGGSAAVPNPPVLTGPVLTGPVLTGDVIPITPPDGTLEGALRAQLPTALGFKPLIAASASAHAIPDALVAAIGSVESDWGTGSEMRPKGPMGTGDHTGRAPKPPLRPGPLPPDGLGFGRGLMQIDWDAHPFARTGNWRDAAANIDFACQFLASLRRQFVSGMGFGDEESTWAAVAAYNAGFGGASGLIQAQGLKAAFAAGRYGAKVATRFDFFRRNGFGTGVGAAALVASTGGGPYVATDPESFLGQVVGSGQCVPYVQQAAHAPLTASWRKGPLVKGDATVARGTAIATFDPDGTYGNHLDGRSHAAIYLGQDQAGLTVLDQFKNPNTPVHRRVIRFGQPLPVNDGNVFFVIV